jgi:HK97 gp10 family phage protein
MSRVSMNVVGIEHFRVKLQRIPRAAARIVSPALRVGAKITLAESVRLSPKRTGALAASHKVRVSKYQKRGEPHIVVITGKGFFKGDTYYGGFVHLGHKIGSRKLGNARAEVSANPWIRRAADNNKEEVTVRVLQRIRNGIIAEAYR